MRKKNSYELVWIKDLDNGTLQNNILFQLIGNYWDNLN